MSREVELTVNVDHVATVRQARQTIEPDPVHAAVLAELGGADGITVHLREDRRHIQDRDVEILRRTVKVPLNLEMGLAPDIIEIALGLLPDLITLVPERRQELTTEGGLNVVQEAERVKAAVTRFREKGILVSLFVDADRASLETSAQAGADAVELHTGDFANATHEARDAALVRLVEGASLAASLGLKVHAGHGLTYTNVQPVAAIPEISELAIGHSIIARAVMVGMETAVREMKALILRARNA
ncbi:MAG: pyridoxine 5'-phosphate synthase [Planctomycetota bacterium]|jgi:pyridoxine 5-phosphate synthase